MIDCTEFAVPTDQFLEKITNFLPQNRQNCPRKSENRGKFTHKPSI